MRKLTHLVLLFTAVLSCLAKDGNKQSLTVRAVASTSQTHEHTSSYTIPGRSTTNCSGIGTTIGNTTNASADCQTTSVPAQTLQHTRRIIDVTNIVEANGTRYTITCTANWDGSSCIQLIEGDSYQAEINNNTMWLVWRQGGNQGSEVRMKSKILDIRPAPTSVLDVRPGPSPLIGSSGPDIQTSNVTGTFTGIVRNQTVGVSAPFGVAIREEEGVVYGCIAIQKPLYGSGSLQGVFQGSKISFDSVGFSLGARFSIRFEGELRNAVLRGTYEVSSPSHQDGEFELTKRGSDGPRPGFDLKSCINSLSSF